MSPTRPRDIGTAAESAVVRYLRTAGFPHAERRSLRGALDAGDITGTPGIAWEVKGGAAAKGASDGQVYEWLVDTDRERLNAHADIGVLILVRAGIGPANAGRWWAVLPGAAVRALQGGEPVNTTRRLSMGAPMRMHLADACFLIRACGYGAQAEEVPACSS